MNFKELADILFPNTTKTPELYESMYPLRNIPKNAKVTRIAPSPTGFMHLGVLFGALTDERLAHLSDGVFYLRIEDTDAKREVEGGIEGIITGLKYFGIKFDEGALINGDLGDYGPYRQRQRKEIYQTFAKQLVSEGKAYPCFCDEDELLKIRTEQNESKVTTGYYGKWTRCKDLKLDVIKAKMEEGKPFVLRYFSEGNENNTVKLYDELKGEIEFPEHTHDDVLLKSDGIPTYHFAHAVDDHLMRTTHVVRGEEWLSSVPFHIALFKAFNWNPPKYIHTAQIMKMDGNSKRKLSKRKDPELALDFYKEQGYPIDAILEYLMTILNSNYEEWRLKNPLAPRNEFKFKVEKMSASGALFDLVKLEDVSRNIIAGLTAGQVYDEVSKWAQAYDEGFYKLLTKDPDYTLSILSIGRGTQKPRKDIAKWSDVKEYIGFFYDELFMVKDNYPDNVSPEDIKAIISEYINLYDPEDDQNTWFGKIRDLASNLGYCGDMKKYKKNPENYKGHVGDVSTVLRIAVTGRGSSPDTYTVFNILGIDKIKQRLST